MDIWEQMLELEPFLRHIGIEAEALGPDQAILRLPVRREITNHTGGIHGGAQFALGEAIGVTAAGLSLGIPLDQLLVLTATSTIIYSRPLKAPCVAAPTFCTSSATSCRQAGKSEAAPA